MSYPGKTTQRHHSENVPFPNACNTQSSNPRSIHPNLVKSLPSRVLWQPGVLHERDTSVRPGAMGLGVQGVCSGLRFSIYRV